MLTFLSSTSSFVAASRWGHDVELQLPFVAVPDARHLQEREHPTLVDARLPFAMVLDAPQGVLQMRFGCEGMAAVVHHDHLHLSVQNLARHFHDSDVHDFRRRLRHVDGLVELNPP